MVNVDVARAQVTIEKWVSFLPELVDFPDLVTYITASSLLCSCDVMLGLPDGHTEKPLCYTTLLLGAII